MSDTFRGLNSRRNYFQELNRSKEWKVKLVQSNRRSQKKQILFIDERAVVGNDELSEKRRRLLDVTSRLLE